MHRETYNVTVMYMGQYTFRVIIEPDGRRFHAYAPALPGCHTHGKTITEAQKHIKDAIELYVEVSNEQVTQ